MKPVKCDKGFFLKFFSPYCPHCNRMKQDWIDFHLQEKMNVHVGSIDCTANESAQICQEFSIQAYPTLIYCPPDSTDERYVCKKYNGERTVDAFTTFYQTNYLKSRDIYEVPKLSLKEYPQKSLL
jgi:protein disulfide-isomerase